MLGFQITVTSDPAQVPNNPGWGGVAIQNLDTTTNTIDLCDDPGFPSAYIYTLQPGSWYSFVNPQTVNPQTGQPSTIGTQSYWARVTPGGVGSIPAWVNPGGAANVGRFAAGTPLSLQTFLDIEASIQALALEPDLNPPAGQDWQFTLPGPGRIAALQMVLKTDVGGTDRYPYLYIWYNRFPLKVQMSSNPISPGSTNEFYGYLNWGSAPFQRGLDPVQTFSIPAITLPKGTLVQAFTSNLLPGDQWSDVGVVPDLDPDLF
jgi:hypothetical protein